MNGRISSLFLIVFLVLLALSAGLLSVAGNNWPWYAIMGGCALVAVVVGPKWHRLVGLAAMTLAVALIMSDLAAGVHYRKRFEKFRDRSLGVATTNGEPQDAANRNQPVHPGTNPASAPAGSGR